MEKSKTTGIYIQATESQKQQIKSIAKACGLKQGDYILKTVLGYRPKAVLPDVFFIYYDSLVKFLNSNLTPDIQKKALALFDKIYHEFLDVKKLSRSEIVKQISGSPQSLLCGEKEQPLTGKPFDACGKSDEGGAL